MPQLSLIVSGNGKKYFLIKVYGILIGLLLTYAKSDIFFFKHLLVNIGKVCFNIDNVIDS